LLITYTVCRILFARCFAGGKAIKTISLLGSGWLGLPLAERLLTQGYPLKISTTSPQRLSRIAALPARGFIVDIGKPMDDIDTFLRSDMLIVNIPSRDIDGFERLLRKIEASPIQRVLLVSSTSVYPDNCKLVSETAADESPDHPLLIIENLFRNSRQLRTTVVRFAGLIGGNRHPGRFFAGGKTVKNPDARVNLIHRDDCINILERIIVNGVWGETFNACADSHPSKREFYTRAAKMAGAPLPNFEDSDDSCFKIVDNRRLKRVLGYEFLHPDLMAIRFDQDRQQRQP
jgi:nucleoside-diphosphate-sugar epimerase